MAKPVRILIVEDSENDSTLLMVAYAALRIRIYSL
jgi:hypothetical protein